MLSEARGKLNRLRARCAPFTMLTGPRAAEAIESLAVFELRPGESVTVRPGSRTDYLYVVEGEVEVTPSGGPSARYVPSDTDVRPIELEAGGPPLTIASDGSSLLARADGDTLDYLLSWETLGAGLGIESEALQARLAAVRRSLAFRRMPLECVEEAFRRMRQVQVHAGEEVVRLGEPGDAFYIIESGRAEVWRPGLYDDVAHKVDEMGPGEAFGEEALLTGGVRGATVRMIEDGTLLVMDKADFEALIGEPMVEHVEAKIAQACLDSGYIPLDVRYGEEFEEAHIPGAFLIPLPELRHRFHELDPAARYLVYCRSGRRSAVAALLMKQRGLHAVSLREGIRGWPFATEVSTVIEL